MKAEEGKGSRGRTLGPDSPLADWLVHLESLHPKGQSGIELGLERVRRVKMALGQSQHCPVITVGGTNGKGSTCACLESLLHAAGYRVGCYTSPHLFAYNERVRLNRQVVEDDLLSAAFARVETARQRAGDVALTYFEFGTLAAWEVFAETRVDAIVLEVGLGGRLDAVNVYDADVAIVTTVDLDHTDWLGSTREKIGFEKAGIFRAGKPAFCADPDPPRSLMAQASVLGCTLHRLNHDFGYEYSPCREAWQSWCLERGEIVRQTWPKPTRLWGAVQCVNAAVAMAALAAAELPLSKEARMRGLAEVRMPARFEVLSENPMWIVDVAHNPQAVSVLAANLDSCPVRGRTHALVGMLADKDADTALTALEGRIDVWHVTTLTGWRGAPAERLAAIISAQAPGAEIFLYSSPEAAVQAVQGSVSESDRIIAFGSFHTVAGVMNALGHGR